MKCKVRSKLREDREVLVIATREERKKIYNLSLEIEQIDRDIDKLLLR